MHYCNNEKNCKDYILKEVCKTFFSHTLDICDRTVALSKQMIPGVCQSERRGTHGKCKKTPIEQENYAKAHILSFSTLDAQYSRKDSKQKYLKLNLSLPKLYALYLEKCNQENQRLQPVKMNIYKIYPFTNPKRINATSASRLKIA